MGNNSIEDAYVMPPVDSAAEKASFNTQSDKFNTSSPPPKMAQAISSAESALAAARFSLPADWGTQKFILRVCEAVRATSGKKSAGAIFQRQGLHTVEDVFVKYQVAGIAAQVQERIQSLQRASLEEARYICDPTKLFIKRQAHKRAKALEKRWRLIWGVSLIDRLVDQVLYASMLQASFEASGEIPCKPGYNFKKGGVDKMVRKYGADGSRKWTSYDAKSYDFTVAGWKLEATTKLNKRLCNNPTPEWLDLVDKREAANAYGTFVFSDGTVCKKLQPGLQQSGRFLTIDSNSKGMLLMRFAYDHEHGRVPGRDNQVLMGDDSVQKDLDPAHFIAWNAKHGVILTYEGLVDGEGKPQAGGFHEQNFCSMDFVRRDGTWVGVPRNLELNLHSLAHPEKKKLELQPERLTSVCIEYAFHPIFPKLHALLAQKSPLKHSRSADWFREVHTGWESPLQWFEDSIRWFADVDWFSDMLPSEVAAAA